MASLQPHQSLAPPRPTKFTGAKLLVEAGPDAGYSFVVRESAVIGRENASVLLDDVEVSRSHAKIAWEDSGYVIHDLRSCNGTFVNDARVNSRRLEHGDRIRIGHSVVVFQRYDPLELEVAHRQRMETLGRMTAGVAHDFNNVLSVVLGNLEYARILLAEGDKLEPEVAECFGDMRAAIERASALTPRLLTCTRTHGDARRVSVSGLCSEICAMIRRTFPRSITVVEHIDDEAIVVADDIGLHQVIVNLCVNARDAMSDAGGELTVRVNVCEPGTVDGFERRRAVRVEVSDTGRGMDEATAAQIFEPFFSTKGPRGYGIGLSTTRALVGEYDGAISVSSQVGRGTRFVLTFPAALPQPRTRIGVPTNALPGVQGNSPSMSHTILVVDDEELLRKAVRRMLQRAGFDVLVASDGADAIRKYAACDPRPSLVLMDLDMPVMGGEQAMRIIRGLDETVQLVVVTGHHDESREHRLRSEGVLAVIRKPVCPNDLVQRIKRMLGVDAMTAPRLA